MGKKNSAFPIVEAKYSGIHSGFENVCTEPGMSKRFYAACMAMQGLLSNPSVRMSKSFSDDIIHDSFVFADKLLKQENNE